MPDKQRRERKRKLLENMLPDHPGFIADGSTGRPTKKAKLLFVYLYVCLCVYVQTQPLRGGRVGIWVPTAFADPPRLCFIICAYIYVCMYI